MLLDTLLIQKKEIQLDYSLTVYSSSPLHKMLFSPAI